MNINEEVIRPLLANISVIGLFFIPMITMRLFAEEKRTGTIELLVTSPITDMEVILGKWLAAMLLYGCMLLLTALNFAFLFKYGHPDWKPLVIGYLGLLSASGRTAGRRYFYLHADKKSDYRWRRYLRGVPDALGARMGQRRRLRNCQRGRKCSLTCRSSVTTSRLPKVC